MSEILRKSDSVAMGFLRPVFILLFVANGIWGGSPDTKLEAAIYKEAVLGDLKSAMDDYRRLAAANDTPRPIVARALFQLAGCLEKSGHRDEARAPYARVINEFGDQPAAAQARVRLASWDDSSPEPRNLDFELGVEGKSPPGWSVPALPKEAALWAELRRTGCRSQKGCAVVLGNSPVRVGNLYQTISAAAYRGKMVRFTAWLRMETVDPGDRAQMWLSVDRGRGQQGFFENMNDRPVQTSEWTRREITAEIDSDAKFIEFGVMTYGRGRAWVDGVAFEAAK